MMDVLIFALIASILTGAGKNLLTHVVPGARLPFLESAVVSFALGAGSVALLVLGIGLFGLLYRWALLALLAVLFFIARKDIIGFMRDAREWFAAVLRHNFSSFERFILAALLFVGFFTLIGSLSPVLGMDSSAYHMQDAKVFIRQHRIAYIPYTRESLWPFLIQMLFTLGLCLKGVAVAKLFHFTFYMASTVAIYSLCRRYWPRPNSILAAAVFALSPAIFTVTTYAYTDLAVVFYTVMAFYGFFAWVDTGGTRWFCLSGIMSGFLMGTKITSALVPVTILTLYVHRVLFSAAVPKPKLRPFLIFMAAMIAVCGIWYIRSWIILGNPVYPFATNIFGENGYPAKDFRMGIYETSGVGVGLRQFVELLWHLTMNPVLFGGESIGFVFLVFLPMLLFVRKPTRFICYSAVIGLCLYASWFFIYQYARFFYPTLIFLSILVAIAYYNSLWKDPVARKLAACLFVGGFCYSAVLAVYHNADKFPVVTGFESEQSFLRRCERSYGIAEYVNANLPESEKILIVAEPRLYYFDRDIAMANLAKVDFANREKSHGSKSFEEFLRERGFANYVVFMSAKPANGDSNTPRMSSGFNFTPANLFANDGSELLKKIDFVYRDEKCIYALYKIKGKRA